MKKIFLMAIAALFVLSFGMAYAGEVLSNGVTDFTGAHHDTLEMSPAASTPNNVYEGSAAGSPRTVHTTDTDMYHDAFGPGHPASGATSETQKRNYAGPKTSVRNYDLVIPR